MNNEEVLTNIENQVDEYGFNGTLWISCEKYGAIKTALEYRKPKKPNGSFSPFFRCPSCGNDIDDIQKYCENCGQAIDRSND